MLATFQLSHCLARITEQPHLTFLFDELNGLLYSTNFPALLYILNHRNFTITICEHFFRVPSMPTTTNISSEGGPNEKTTR